MKKIVLSLLALIFCLKVTASDFRTLPYKNIKQGRSITFANSDWTKKNQKDGLLFKRQDNSFYSKDGSIEFDTECDYIFIKEGRLIGYSSFDLKFYEFVFDDNQILRQELACDEISQIFKNYRIILISDFSESTNSLKLKKNRKNKNLMIINDTDLTFDNYGFTSNNAKFKKYNVNNAIEIRKKGLIQFSTSGEDTKNSPWFILLVR